VVVDLGYVAGSAMMAAAVLSVAGGGTLFPAVAPFSQASYDIWESMYVSYVCGGGGSWSWW
jgi:hypothetical protein